MSRIPPLHVNIAPDNSINFEWIDKHFRIGFCFDEQDSSWWLATDEGIGESGFLTNENNKEVINKLILFVQENIEKEKE